MRIYLSKAHVGQRENDYMLAALMSGWVAPAGPDLDAFESELAESVGVKHAVGLSSGTAALHLGLQVLGVKPGDDVIVPTLTFAATAFAVTHAGANPVFLDVDEASWGLDPQLLHDVLRERRDQGRLPTAVLPVDILGRPADHDALTQVCRTYRIPVLVDAAESLGATYRGRPTGGQGDGAIFSFNGNKIITSSAGGAFVTDDSAAADKVRFWSMQSREALPWYEHEEIGYNYRLSNILAALGRAQLSRLNELVERRRQIRQVYRASLAEVGGVSLLDDPPWGRSNHWLTCAVFDPAISTNTAELVRVFLHDCGIEARHMWKPMHLQPVFAESPRYLTGVADRAFHSALCLPSGAGLSDDDIRMVARAIREAL